MKKLLGLAAFFSCFVLLVNDVHAIIFLPALILIPIAKIVAVIIGGLSLPVLSVSGFWGKVTKRSAKRGVFLGIAVLVVISLLLFFVLKFLNPQHPLL